MSDEFYEDDEPVAPRRRVARRSAATRTAVPTKKAAPARRADPRRVATDDAVDEKSTTRKPAAAGKKRAGVPLPRSGWSAAQDVLDSTSSFAQMLKITDSPQLVKFLEDGPYASFAQHWLARPDAKNPGRFSQRPYVCLSSIGGSECPLCDIGIKASAVTSFNVAAFGDDGVMSLRTLNAGVRLTQALKNLGSDPKFGPLSKKFYAISKSGSQQSTQYTALPISNADVVDDWGVDIPDDDELAQLGVYDATVVEISTVAELKELAAETAESYD